MALTLLLFTLVAWCAAVGTWNDFSGAFQMTGLAGGAGYVTGNVVWSWSQSKMLLTFNTGTSATWQETYTFNSTYGYPAQPGTTADPPQYVFTIGSSCSPNCNTASSTSGLPPLSPSLTSYLKSPTGSGTCLTYTPSVSNSLLTSMTASNSQVCTFTLVDGRVFTMTSFTATSTTIATPSNCQCTQAVDIEFLIDHSGSIDNGEMSQFKTFVTNFLNNLTISPTAVNVGMTYFSVPSQVGTNFPMTGDKAVVTAGMAGWAIPCSQGSPQCQGGGTATPSGLKAAADGLYASSRKVPKILITLTDGATNRGYDGSSCCLSTQTGRDAFTGCNSAIDNAIAYIKAKKQAQSYTHTLTLISAGIGTECTADQTSKCYPECRYSPHLIKFADGNTANVLSVDNWSALQSQVANLMALTCVTSNNVAQATCLNTCNGLCVCGGCSPPTGCKNNNCFSYTLSGGSCQPSAIPCPNQPCFVSTCNQAALGGQGQCQYSPISCASVTSGCNNCVKYTCATSGASAGTCSVPDTTGCPQQVDCAQSNWGSWTTCTASCAGGKSTATRTVTQAPQNCGAPCGPANQTFDCNTQPCPTPCVVSGWSLWTDCTVTCGGGTTYRNRTVTAPATNGGTPCPPLSETNSCNPNGCPVDCVWYPWSSFDPCSVTCGGGTQTRSRTIRIQVANGGVNCTGNDTETVPCNNNGCPVDCIWGPWSDYSSCSLTCGNGTQVRTRNQTVPVANGGIDCTGLATATQNCNTQECGCNGTWSGYTPCLCATSTQNRTYTIISNGTNCSAVNQSVQVSGCTPVGCPVDCVGDWTAWSNCSCGTATQSRTFSITQAAQNGGNDCTNTTTAQTQSCNITAAGCPIPCVGSWATWSTCDCTLNTQTRNYTITSPAVNNGTDCPGQQTQTCTPTGCPVPCVGDWSEWGSCPCNGYLTASTQNRSYTVTTPAQNSGTPCDQSAPASRACTAVNCPVDCVGQWSQWSTCDCANETHTRNFTVTKNQSNGGLFCDADDGTSDTQGCTPTGCINYGPKCTGPDDNTSCVDTSLCTQNLCSLQPDGLYHCNWSVPVDCDDNSVCTSDSCDDLKGCQYVDRVCNDGTACTTDFCDPINGCYYTNITCKVNASDFCYQPICDSIIGCTTQQRACADADDDNDNCTLILCNPYAPSNDTACEKTQLCNFSPLIFGLVGGAIAGIVIACAFVALFLLSGATYAIASQQGSEAGPVVHKSPLYVGDHGIQGTNLAT